MTRKIVICSDSLKNCNISFLEKGKIIHKLYENTKNDIDKLLEFKKQ